MVPVHFIDFSDDKVTCDKIEYIGYVNDDELMNEEQVMQKYEWIRQRNKYKWY